MRLLQTLLAALLVLTGLLVLIGLAGAYLHPGPFWWAAIIAVTLPYATVLLALAVLGALALRRLDWAAAGGVVLLLALLRVVPFGWVTPRPSPAGDDLVVMSFNVPRHGERMEDLAAQVYALVAEEHPHIAALQGPVAWRTRQRPRTANVADYVRPVVDSLRYVLAVPQNLPRGTTPQPVLMRSAPDGPVRLGQAETHPLGRVDDPQASVYVRTRFRWQGREAVLYNLHLRGYGPDKPWEEDDFPLLQPSAWVPFVRRYRVAYRERAREVEELRQRVEQETLPVLLVGDFNATPDNWTFRQLARGRTDAFRTGGREWGRTYHSRFPLVRIDHVLADPAFEVVHAKVTDVRFSDHRPLVVRLRWRDEIVPATTENVVP